MNDWDEPRETLQKFVDEAGLTHTILLDGGEISVSRYGVTSSPTSFWIDHTGRIVRRDVGFDPSHFAEMEDRVITMLARRAADATRANARESERPSKP